MRVGGAVVVAGILPGRGDSHAKAARDPGIGDVNITRITTPELVPPDIQRYADCPSFIW
jgi:hypothetical protein